MNLLALSGSLRAESTNARLLRAAARLAPEGVTFRYLDRELADIPAFSPDLDGDGAPPPGSVAAFREAIAAADGVLICCPEYAHGVPGAFKNALDWTVSGEAWAEKPVALIMASASGAPHARAALTPTLKVIGARLVYEVSLVMRRNHLHADGTLTDPAMAEAVTEALRALMEAQRT